MLNINKDWLQQPETRSLINYIKTEIEAYQESWVRGVYEDNSENLKAVGGARALLNLVADIKDSVRS